MNQSSSVILHNVVPGAFASREEPLCSQVWGVEEIVLDKGKRYMLHARSGGGKSSLCAFICGLRRDYEGEIFVNGFDVKAMGQEKSAMLRRNVVAYLPQELGLFDDLTAKENILLKNRLTGHCDQLRIKEMLDRLGVGDLYDRKVAQMSIGQQQRVAIVRALAQPFDFLLLDEPVSHLDAEANARVAALVDDVLRPAGAGLIVTSVGNDLAVGDCVSLQL